MGEAFIVRRGGGANLNFRIKQYPVSTDISQAAGKENDIAVLTATAITNWQLSYSAPDSPAAGDLWIKLASSSLHEIEILKKQSILLYINAAFQYENGAWVRRKAYLYQGGAWNDLDIFLFDNGGQCVQLTGGWKTVNDYNGSCTVLDDRIHFEPLGSSSAGQACYTENKVALSGYTKLCVKMNVTTVVPSYGYPDRLAVGLYTNNTSAYPFNGSYVVTYAAFPTTQPAGDYTLELDISAYKDSSDYYVGFTNAFCVADVYEIWLE